jgi:hypothetical protein
MKINIYIFNKYNVQIVLFEIEAMSVFWVRTFSTRIS